MNRVANRSAGFTIIELLLAMTFVTILLLAIAVTVIQIASIYNKGLTMRAVDQAGRTINTDIRRTLSFSRPFNTGTALRMQGESDNPDGGRLCTGSFSYIWNFGKSLANDQPVNIYSRPNQEEEIRFVKVRDDSGGYCADLEKPIVRSEATELLAAGDRDLAIQSFSIKRLDDDTTDQALYRVVIEIGTNDQGALERSIDSLDTSCRPPSDISSLQDYCAVNQFDFTAQAGSGGIQ